MSRRSNPHQAYTRGPPTHRKNDDPEARLQREVVRALEDLAVLKQLRVLGWTASAAGVRVGMQTATKMRAQGVKRGWPDLQFLCRDGVTRYIELKTDVGSLRPDQKKFRDATQPLGIWAMARSCGEVLDALDRWGLLGAA